MDHIRIEEFEFENDDIGRLAIIVNRPAPQHVGVSVNFATAVGSKALWGRQGLLLGWAVNNTDGANATVVTFTDGANATGTTVAQVTVPFGASKEFSAPCDGIELASGLFVACTAGTQLTAWIGHHRPYGR